MRPLVTSINISISSVSGTQYIEAKYSPEMLWKHNVWSVHLVCVPARWVGSTIWGGTFSDIR